MSPGGRQRRPVPPSSWVASSLMGAIGTQTLLGGEAHLDSPPPPPMPSLFSPRTVGIDSTPLTLRGKGALLPRGSDRG